MHSLRTDVYANFVDPPSITFEIYIYIYIFLLREINNNLTFFIYFFSFFPATCDRIRIPVSKKMFLRVLCDEFKRCDFSHSSLGNQASKLAKWERKSGSKDLKPEILI